MGAFWPYLDSYCVESQQHLEHKKVHLAVSFSDRQLRRAVKVFTYAQVIAVLSDLNTETMPTLQIYPTINVDNHVVNQEIKQ